ncbi:MULTISPECIES: M1 family aminopeptidase [Aequorivita]|uniref:Aminopeptidase N n=1 Tax=Aequorivita iocasae TaxID=2803865 RepID=A0ABX7DTR7_9FLAO|nr:MULTISPECIES: M1 family aminopeptidase [Aequorivita]QQX77535.1 T9SS type A sorting domain-containing protein [Aequorivita iocasae]UCA57028.1 T9SS type A sorting domain-containing protein [Aequorivita sp. F7]
MKPLLLPFLISISFLSFSQNSQEDISEAEAKAATGWFGKPVNLNTGNYDLKYHRLEFTVNPAQAFITGTVTSHFVAKENLNTVTFELVDNMTVSQVMQRGTPLSFTQNNDDEVVITLPQMQAQGVLDSLSVSYSGNPVSSGFGSFETDTHNGDPVMWTLSEPFGAKAWWPCKQDLNDKIDMIDIYITTPRFNPSNEEYIAVANGLEISQTINGSNKTTHYRHQYPIPAYLIAIAVTNYTVYSHTVANNGNPFEIVNYIYPEDLSYAQSRTPVTVDIMNLYADLFEPYPYANEKYGHAQFGWGGGMEHTTVSFMGSLSRGLIAHELGHQWFGDKVTCGSWQDIWLNEGFATYLSGLVIEDFDGPSDFRSWRQDKINSITDSPDGSVYVPAQDTTSVNRIFCSRLSYNKGSMVLHMLRKKLGDAVFFQGLKDYLADPALSYGYAKTPDLIRNMEAASGGEDLSEFFDDWVYGEGYPRYTVQWNQGSGPATINLKISQTQSHPSVSFFEASVPLRINGTQGETLDIVLENTTNNQAFQSAVGFTVQSVQFDPDYHLISRNNNVVLGTEDFTFGQQLVLYPNPTSGFINLEKPASINVQNINIYNTLGQMLYSEKYSESIDVSKFSKGVLFFKIETSEGIINKRIVKD